LIIHSPLVGPSTVAPLAETLEARSWTTHVPDLRAAVASAARFGRAVASAANSVDVVIGHSGAGAFLPGAAAAAGGATAVFIDAVVPPALSPFSPSPQLSQLLDTLVVVDGVLPPWHEWWPTAVLAELVPDAELRGRITAEIPGCLERSTTRRCRCRQDDGGRQLAISS